MSVQPQLDDLIAAAAWVQSHGLDTSIHLLVYAIDQRLLDGLAGTDSCSTAGPSLG